MFRRLSPLLLTLLLAPLPAPQSAHADMQAGRAAFAAGKYDAAFKEFAAAGDKGDLTALYLAAEMQLRGRGTERDVTAALALMRRAAEGGHVGAMSALGAIYAYGQDVPADYAQALHWLRPAAEADDMHAQNNLATLLYFGLGTEKDIVGALHWARRAAARNLVAAVQLAAEIAAVATPEQASTANALLARPLAKRQPAKPVEPAPAPPPRPVAAAAVPPAPEAPISATPAATGGDWAVQLGSLPSRAEAEKHWAGLARRHAGLLDGRQPVWEVAEVGGKGRYTRVLLAGFNKAAAGDFCTRLKQEGADCLVRRAPN